MRIVRQEALAKRARHASAAPLFRKAEVGEALDLNPTARVGRYRGAPCGGYAESCGDAPLSIERTRERFDFAIENHHGLDFGRVFDGELHFLSRAESFRGGDLLHDEPSANG